jgi:glycosyltransferase involved in cell wall biosynthesis
MNILVLTPYAPWPPYGGGTMRMFQLIRGLAAVHQVTSLSFVTADVDQEQLRRAMAPTTVLTVMGPRARNLLQRGVQTMLHPWPDMALRNYDATYASALTALLKRQSFDVVVAFSIEMSPYLSIARAHGIATVFDQFNAEFVIQKRAFETDINQPKRWHAAAYSFVQWQKLRWFERTMMQQADVVTVVSPDDATTLRALNPAVTPIVVPNGVDTRYFDRGTVSAHPFVRPTIVFSGTLDFRANVDALHWMVNEVMPQVHAQVSDAMLIAVGRRPHKSLLALQSSGALALTGEIADTRPYLCGAHVYVVPMRIGGGVRLKVLEAMSLMVPVISTAMGLEGIEGMRPEYAQVADTATAMANAIVASLDKAPDTVPARNFVIDHYDWQVIVPRFVTAVQQAAQRTTKR